MLAANGTSIFMPAAAMLPYRGLHGPFIIIICRYISMLCGLSAAGITHGMNDGDIGALMPMPYGC